MVEGAVIHLKSVHSGLYVTVVKGGYRFEVPYGFDVQMATALRLWGLSMVNPPYREQETPW